jgi:hypothetical protein
MKTFLAAVIVTGMMFGVLSMAVHALDAEAKAFEAKITKHVARIQP